MPSSQMLTSLAGGGAASVMPVCSALCAQKRFFWATTRVQSSDATRGQIESRENNAPVTLTMAMRPRISSMPSSGWRCVAVTMLCARRRRRRAHAERRRRRETHPWEPFRTSPLPGFQERQRFWLLSVSIFGLRLNNMSEVARRKWNSYAEKSIRRKVRSAKSELNFSLSFFSCSVLFSLTTRGRWKPACEREEATFPLKLLLNWLESFKPKRACTYWIHVRSAENLSLCLARIAKLFSCPSFFHAIL